MEDPAKLQGPDTQAALERGYAELAASLNDEDAQVAKAIRVRRDAR